MSAAYRTYSMIILQFLNDLNLQCSMCITIQLEHYHA
jgi:hypothetical protein